MKFAKTVTDPVHGNIELTAVEAEVMRSETMQRLQNVRQLGLAHLVYPGAIYNRFAHSIGACHNAGRLLNAISRERLIDDSLMQEYRLVALLHDIGHYPFSYATEHVVEDFYAKGLIAISGTDGSQKSEEIGKPSSPILSAVSPPAYKHEPLGEIILRNSDELKKIFSAFGIDQEHIADRFAKKIPDGLIGIISSDLDCDRLDYLKRTALHSGAPYGLIDIGFLIDQATVASDGTFCFNPKAARAADHLLIARYFDYMQVPYNKTVVALEWSLTVCLRELLQLGKLDCSGPRMETFINSSDWITFDDQYVFGLFRELLRTTGDNSLTKDHLKAILSRRPAKLLACWDEIHQRQDTSKSKNEYIIQSELQKFAAERSLDIDRFHTWNKSVFFSKMDGSLAVQLQEENLAEAVLILDPDTKAAIPLVYRKDTLINHLSSSYTCGLRVYYLPEEGQDIEAIRIGLVSRLTPILGTPVA